MRWSYILLLSVFFSSHLHAQDTTAREHSNVSKIKLSGYGYYMFGQVVSGVYGDEWAHPTTTFEHYWSNITLTHLHISSDVTDWFSTELGFEISVRHYFKGCCAMNNASYWRDYEPYLTSVASTMHWDFRNRMLRSLRIASGLIPYTINPTVKTLGNYLFRSTVHPPSVQNKLDYPWADFIGVITEVGLFDNKVTVSAMLASEFVYIPFFDLTPAFALFYKPNNIIDIGGAVAFSHAIPIDERSNIHEVVTRHRYDGNGQIISDYLDTINTDFHATKLNLRAIFDPKPLFGGMNFLGKSQLNIYAEIAFLGLKDSLEVDTSSLARLRSYDPTDSLGLNDLVFPENSIIHRMPFMIGINLPTWKLLDLLSVEFEWFFSPYANDWFGLFDNMELEARQPSSLEQWDNYINKDNFKWAINIRKSFGKFETRALFSSDHTIYRMGNRQTGNFEQTMKRPKDWHWFVELRYNL
jgi:hypothetical protein